MPVAELFISYARGDAAQAGRLASALHDEGFDVWWDRRVTGGAEYSREIEEALDRSSKVLVLWSANSVDSAWVRDEAAAARDSSKLVPVTIDGTTPPLGFRQYHTLNLAQWLVAPGRSLPAELLGALRSDPAWPKLTRELHRFLA